MTDALFERTTEDLLNSVQKMLDEERNARIHMLRRHPESTEYWQRRIAQADAAIEDIHDIRKAVATWARQTRTTTYPATKPATPTRTP